MGVKLGRSMSFKFDIGRLHNFKNFIRLTFEMIRKLSRRATLCSFIF